MVIERQLDWEALRNARDLGGLPLRGGRTTRFSSIVRTETTRELTTAGWSSATEYGITTILDLREPEEVRANRPLYGGSILLTDRVVNHAPEASDAQVPARRVNVPVLDWTPGLGDHLDRLSLAERDAVNGTRAVYLEMLQRGQARFARAVRAVVETSDGAVLIHCHAGKDRTGLLVALLLATVGADVEAIADDYALSGKNLAPFLDSWLADCADARERELRARAASTPRAAMLDVLSDLEARHGGAEAYLLSGGATEAELARLHEHLVV